MSSWDNPLANDLESIPVDPPTPLPKDEQKQSPQVAKSTSDYKITLTDPQKTGEGLKNAYVTYAMTTIKNREKWTVRRRFGDFAALHQLLTKDFPAVVIPPLPSKHRLEYLDRFDEEFIEKRRVSLERMMSRFASHPILSQSQSFKTFLQQELWSPVSEMPAKEESIMENMGDFFLNAFAKVKKPDEKFSSVGHSVEIYQENLQSIEKNLDRLIKSYDDLSAEFSALGLDFGSLAATSPGLAESFNLAASVSTEIGSFSYTHDQIGYCQSIKDTLKQRDQKQIDFESLTDYLQQVKEERERVERGRTGGGGATGFLKEKFDEIKGSDSAKNRVEKLAKLEQKIIELTKAVENSLQISNGFSTEVTKELDYFQDLKVKELKLLMNAMCQNHLKFFQSGLEQYEKLEQYLQSHP